MMLSDLTTRIFKVLGKDLSLKGILTVDQLPPLILTLQTAIEQDAIARKSMSVEELATSDRLGQRAYPFLELLKSANQSQNPIVWGV